MKIENSAQIRFLAISVLEFRYIVSHISFRASESNSDKWTFTGPSINRVDRLLGAT